MRLDEYEWSHNPRGMHIAGAPAVNLNVDELVRTRMGWCKVVSLDREAMPAIAPMLANNITPIIRVYRARFGASPPDEDMYNAWMEYRKSVCAWCELYKEPNFEIEWPTWISPYYNDITNVIGPLMTNWLAWAEGIIQIGGYPAFPALGEATGV